jgi:hypothetical protein
MLKALARRSEVRMSQVSLADDLADAVEVSESTRFPAGGASPRSLA